MKIRQIPNHLWSKHPYLTIAGTVIGLSVLVAASFFTLGLGLLIPAIVAGSLFAIGVLGAFSHYVKYGAINIPNKYRYNPNLNLTPAGSENIPDQTVALNQHPSNLSQEQFDPVKLLAASKTGDKKTINKHLDLLGQKMLIEALENGNTDKAIEALKSFGSIERTFNILSHANNLGNTILMT